MAERGLDVRLEDDPERPQRRLDMGIPDETASCHTALIAGDAIEGHVPTQALERLLAEKPDIIGLALPGMPVDSPGMGGDETTWASQSVVSIAGDGLLAPFSY